ncbi:hypothetical protein OE88DRAFT_1641158 [Heliocybe sulcata]|uniref:Uncharacterized protein n=1 Tax=Heliocybe sulcata TaxID=5364 RepID=A0A5C3NJG3_9AGAM|nr:hypothetical protein OE88DRAFT_1641158 [Heliocybe sulcata]
MAAARSSKHASSHVTCATLLPYSSLLSVLIRITRVRECMNTVEDFMLSLSKEIVVCTPKGLTNSRQKLRFERYFDFWWFCQPAVVGDSLTGLEHTQKHALRRASRRRKSINTALPASLFLTALAPSSSPTPLFQASPYSSIPLLDNGCMYPHLECIVSSPEAQGAADEQYPHTLEYQITSRVNTYSHRNGPQDVRGPGQKHSSNSNTVVNGETTCAALEA